jgi:hypothetical protein
MLTADQVLDNYFLEARCQLLEVAAMLDRYDRANTRDAVDHAHLQLIYRALERLADRKVGKNRVEQLLNLFTDSEP